MYEMKCVKCNSEWTVGSIDLKCPECGATGPTNIGCAYKEDTNEATTQFNPQSSASVEVSKTPEADTEGTVDGTEGGGEEGNDSAEVWGQPKSEPDTPTNTEGVEDLD